MHLKVNKEKRTSPFTDGERFRFVGYTKFSIGVFIIRESQKQESKSRKISESKWQIWQLFAARRARACAASSAAAHSRAKPDLGTGFDLLLLKGDLC